MLAWKLKGLAYLKVEPELLNMDSDLDIETLDYTDLGRSEPVTQSSFSLDFGFL